MQFLWCRRMYILDFKRIEGPISLGIRTCLLLPSCKTLFEVVNMNRILYAESRRYLLAWNCEKTIETILESHISNSRVGRDTRNISRKRVNPVVLMRKKKSRGRLKKYIYERPGQYFFHTYRIF